MNELKMVGMPTAYQNSLYPCNWTCVYPLRFYNTFKYKQICLYRKINFHPYLYVAYLREDRVIISLGNQIRALRKRKKISQAQLAADCNIEISQISRIERGIINTSVSQLAVIARSLKVQLKDLVDFDI